MAGRRGPRARRTAASSPRPALGLCVSGRRGGGGERSAPPPPPRHTAEMTAGAVPPPCYTARRGRAGRGTRPHSAADSAAAASGEPGSAAPAAPAAPGRCPSPGRLPSLQRRLAEGKGGLDALGLRGGRCGAAGCPLPVSAWPPRAAAWERPRFRSRERRPARGAQRLRRGRGSPCPR